MKKMLSLIKTCMSDNMSLFRIKTKNQSKTSKKLAPIFIGFLFFFTVWGYANMMMEPLVQVHMEPVLLTLFIAYTTIITLVEGIYKSGSLLFNCKDDSLLLSLPIKKSTVLFIRVFKFYVFELLYNSLFLLPAMLVYIRYVSVEPTFYLVSLIGLLLIPVIPIIISCIIGGFVSSISTKFKYKNIAEIMITIVVLIVVLYLSFNFEGLVAGLGSKAQNINDALTTAYYPAKAYIKMITDFNVKDFLVFIGVHVLISAISVLTLGKVYFKINSKMKSVKWTENKKKTKIKTSRPMKALIKKELRRFINSPVFVTNAAFGVIIFLLGCILLSIKFDTFAGQFASQDIGITAEQIKEYIPALLFAFICISSLMSSITSSMISLEGKSFSILKSLPVTPFTIILSKILTAVIIMIPFILIGDLIVFINFKFNILEIIMIIAASVLLPLFAETIGIIINIKYPKMDADSDAEVVKQSMSSNISVILGMLLTVATLGIIAAEIMLFIIPDFIISTGIIVYAIMYIFLILYMNKKSIKEFNSINV